MTSDYIMGTSMYGSLHFPGHVSHPQYVYVLTHTRLLNRVNYIFGCPQILQKMICHPPFPVYAYRYVSLLTCNPPLKLREMDITEINSVGGVTVISCSNPTSCKICMGSNPSQRAEHLACCPSGNSEPQQYNTRTSSKYQVSFSDKYDPNVHRS
jgi:hypothetical protein